MRTLVLALVLSLLAATARAGELYTPPEFLTQAPALPPGHEGAKVLALGLDDALVLAMKQNLGIQLERKALKIANLTEKSVFWGLYEPILSVGYSHSGSDTPPMTLQAGEPGAIITSGTDTWGASVSQRLPTGGSISVGMSNSRVSSSAGTAVEPLNYSSSVSLSISQPLFRGFSTDLVIPRYAERTARLATEQERHAFEINAATLVQQTESAYWDVVLALYSYGVTVKSQELAQNTLDLTRRQIAAGMTPASELTGAENTVAQREIAVLSAAATVDQAWDALRTVLNLPRDQWNQPILPTDRPKFRASALPTDQAALDLAISRRPEIRQSDLDLEASRLSMRKTENDALPQIDLGVNASLYGQDSTYGGALSQLGDHRATGWGITLNLTWTPMQRASKTAVELARIQHEIKIANREQRVQGIWNEVRSALRNQRAAALQVTAASKARTLANESLQIENKKYATGNSSNINVATLQNGLASAELTELSALLGHERAQTALLLATGQLLEQRHINLEVAHK